MGQGLGWEQTEAGIAGLGAPMLMPSDVPSFNRGGMVHDERTIRNVDDEIYRIAPKTYEHGSAGRNARDEYERDMREKRYLHHQMNRMANGGEIASMGMTEQLMAPPPMMAPPPPPMMPPEAQVQQLEQSAAQEGEQLGAMYLNEMMTGLDTAGSTAEVIDAIRGTDKPLEARYDELATFVGENDASATPESVLALVQPTIMMTEQGAMDSGIGELMEGLTGEIDMQTDMGGPTPMGQGVGELMVTESVEEVLPQMNAGGPIQYFQQAGEVASAGGPTMEQVLAYMNMLQGTERMVAEADADAAPVTPRSLQDYMAMYQPMYEQVMMPTEEEKDFSKSQIWLDLARRGLAYAGGVNPDTGAQMSGSPVSQLAQAAMTLPQTVAQAKAPIVAAKRQSKGQALTSSIAGMDYERKLALEQAKLKPEMVMIRDGDGANLGTFNLLDPADLTKYENVMAANPSADVFTIGDEPTPRQPAWRNVIVDDQIVGSVDTNIPGEVTKLLAANNLADGDYTLAMLNSGDPEHYQSAFDVMMEKDEGQLLVDIRTDSTAATRENQQLSIIEALIQKGDFTTGTASELRQGIGRLNQLIGTFTGTAPLSMEIVEDPATATAMQSVFNAMALDIIDSMKGLRATNLNMQVVQQVIPQLSATPEGNLLLIQVRRAMNNFRIATQDIASKYRSVEGGPFAKVDGKTLDEAMIEYENANPVLSPELEAEIQATGGEEAQEGMLQQVRDIDAAALAANMSTEAYLEGLSIFEQYQYQFGNALRDRRIATTEAIISGSRLAPGQVLRQGSSGMDYNRGQTRTPTYGTGLTN